MKRIRIGAVVLAMGLAGVTSGCAVLDITTSAGALAVHLVSTTAEVAVGVGRVATNIVGAGYDALTPRPAPPPVIFPDPPSPVPAPPLR